MTCLVTFLLKGSRKEREDVMKVEKKMNVWMDGKERCKVETFIAVDDAVNQQMASRFAEQQIAFMAQLWHFTPRSLLEGQKYVKTGDVADTCEMYGADADEVC